MPRVGANVLPRVGHKRRGRFGKYHGAETIRAVIASGLLRVAAVGKIVELAIVEHDARVLCPLVRGELNAALQVSTCAGLEVARRKGEGVIGVAALISPHNDPSNFVPTLDTNVAWVERGSWASDERGHD